MHLELPQLLRETRVGLNVGEHEITAAVISTGTGRSEEPKLISVPYKPENLAAVVREVLTECVGDQDRSRVKIILGLPTLRLFLLTRTITDKQSKETPQTLLHEMIQSSAVVIDDMTVDMVKHSFNQQKLAGLVCCREKYLTGVVAALEASEFRPTGAEPAACALMRVASRDHKPPRKAKMIIRVFLGGDQGLAVLSTRDDLPIRWRPFEMTPGTEACAIIAAVASVRMLGRQSGLKSEASTVMIHGRPDLSLASSFAETPGMEELELLHMQGPELNDVESARGLVLTAKTQAEPFNLVRLLQGQPRFLDIFPWGQAAISAVLLIAATIWLACHLESHKRVDRQTRADDRKYSWASKLSSDKLAAEKKDLEERIESVRSFMGTRILWTAYHRALAARLTPELAIVSVTGSYELESPGQRVRPKRILTFNFASPIPRTGTMPPQIDAFLKNLRDAPLFKKDFPDVEMSDLRWINSSGNGLATANFSVVCQPVKAAAKNQPKAAPKAKGAK